MKKRLTSFQFIYSTARGADKRTGRSPLANHPDPRAFHPQDSPRRGRVPVQCYDSGCLPLGGGFFGFRAFDSPAGGEI